MAEARGRCPALRRSPLPRPVPSAARAARGAGTRAMEEPLPPPPPVGSSKPHLEKLTLGITRILEASPGVTEVTIIEKAPAEHHMICSWEQKNNCILPEDVKNFYLMTNGFHMTWNVKLDEHTIPLGSMAINSIAKLTPLHQSSMYSLPNAPTLADLEDDPQEGPDHTKGKRLCKWNNRDQMYPPTWNNNKQTKMYQTMGFKTPSGNKGGEPQLII
ncbi:PREDICTED: tubulin polyglutamylase complex subunit 2 isoform X3 [Miniopterus natalensis]|uniref:tubulin polyglutamylase complex subunit 2 isoform X3 n=1 Tax=Miniopterus natalensis TaxID=291302 RepID=UPI0007A6C682|nr:PREDICTED: tubulin polyglutamylase complex subunit 2 isoform X3 [Miniopterus natalensis]